MIRIDEGPSLNWSPSEVENLSEYEVRLYNDALSVFREKYRSMIKGDAGS